MKAVHARTRHQTWCLYGPSGAGKSTLAVTAPKPVVLDSNQGLLSIADRPGFEHVRSEDVHKLADLEKAYDKFTGTSKKTDWSKKFDTLVFDHFDDIQTIVMEELGDRRHERDERKDEDEAEQRDWGIMGNKLRRLIRRFKSVPIHKILICGEVEDRETGRMRPSLIGALKHQFPYFVDHTVYLRIGKKGQRYAHLDSTEDFYAKTRAWWLPAEYRKIKIDFQNTKQLSELFALIAAGPKGLSTAAGDE